MTDAWKNKMVFPLLTLSALWAPAGLCAESQTKSAAAPPPALRIEKRAADYSATERLTEARRELIKKANSLKGPAYGAPGAVDYAVSIPQTGWYELWVEGSGGCELRIDGKFLLNSQFDGAVWAPRPNEKARKVLNLRLTAGEHVLTFDKPDMFGLPGVSRFFLEASTDIVGKFHVSLENDKVIFRKGEKFSVTLAGAGGEHGQKLEIRIVDAITKNMSSSIGATLPAGRDDYSSRQSIPTDKEGVFDIEFKDEQGRSVDRTIQYAVVDTATPPVFAKELKPELVQEIDCAQKAADYESSPSRVMQTPCGAYRESGEKGRDKFAMDQDFFAYTLSLPSIQEPYMIEFEYPDDDYRNFTMAVVEQFLMGYAPCSGVNSGGVYSLSGQMRQSRIYYYPKNKDPRVVVYNWNTGLRAAISKIRVYRFPDGLPGNLPVTRGRDFGTWQEEGITRDIQNFGPMPSGEELANYVPSLERLGQLSNFVGANMNEPTVCVYQTMYWPSAHLPGYQICDQGISGGPAGVKSPVKRDLMRLEALICEKYRLDFIPQVFNNGNRYLYRNLDVQFGGDGALYLPGDDPIVAADMVYIPLEAAWKKPWLSFDKNGQRKGAYFNPVHPGVQDWMVDVLKELALRYKDSPAFKGVAIRIMGWTFNSWQCFPSLDCGYEDFTVNLFEKETGIKVPVDTADSLRFQKRYEWLMANAYQKWVDWRCAKIGAYHKRLAAALTAARPDLKLYLDLERANPGVYSISDWDRKGWLGLAREAGLDPAVYRSAPSIILNNYRDYPTGGRGFWGGRVAGTEACDMDFDMLPPPLTVAAKPLGNGTVNGMYFNSASYEGDFIRFDRIGLPKTGLANREAAHAAGVTNGAGWHVLDKFAASLAEGNVIHIFDGNHGHNLGTTQPQYTGAFLNEYLSLPAIGMNRLEASGDPVALWSGEDGGATCFYMVNRCDFPVEASVGVDRGVTRLVGDQPVALKNGALTVSLGAYELRAFRANGRATFTNFSVKAPDNAAAQLRSQLDFSEKLIQDDRRGPTILELSQVQMREAVEQLRKAQDAFRKGELHQTRRLLLSHQMVAVFEAFGAYPPNLFYRKTPERTGTALLPDALWKMIPESERGRASVIDAGSVDPALAGTPALVWSGVSPTFVWRASNDNRYRLSFSYLARPPFGRPVFLMDGKEIPGQSELVEETSGWGKKIVLPPLMMPGGDHVIAVKPSAQKIGLLALDLPPVYRDITADQWRMIGPFPGTEMRAPVVAKQMEMALPPERERNFSASYDGVDGKKVSWITAKTKSDYVDFWEVLGLQFPMIGYAVTRIDSSKEREAEISFGVDYWAKIWLNGEVVCSPDRHLLGASKGRNFIPVKLRQGENEFLVKIHCGSRGSGFWFGISDIGDLKFVIDPVEGGK